MLIRYYGHVGQRTGYGRAASDLCHALAKRPGVHLEIRALAPYNKLAFEGPDLPLAKLVKTDDELNPHADVCIVHTLPMDCSRVVEIAGWAKVSHVGLPSEPLPRSERPLLVAYTTWEGSSVTSEVIDHLAVFDHVLVPSCQTMDALEVTGIHLRRVPTEHKIMRSVAVLPHCFDETSLEVRRGPSRLTQDRYMFYYIGAWNSRKNPMAVLRTYIAEFSPSEQVGLVLRSANCDQRNFYIHLHSTGVDPSNIPPVYFSGDYATDAHIAALHRIEGDCFVTASRGESWNLPAFDAMLAGRHVIAPRWTGSDEYLRYTDAFRYDSTLTPAHVDVVTKQTDDLGSATTFTVIGAQGLTSRCLWREPNLIELASYMRTAFQERRRNLTHQGDPREIYGYDAIGKRALSILEGDPK